MRRTPYGLHKSCMQSVALTTPRGGKSLFPWDYSPLSRVLLGDSISDAVAASAASVVINNGDKGLLLRRFKQYFSRGQ